MQNLGHTDLWRFKKLTSAHSPCRISLTFSTDWQQYFNGLMWLLPWTLQISTCDLLQAGWLSIPSPARQSCLFVCTAANTDEDRSNRINTVRPQEHPWDSPAWGLAHGTRSTAEVQAWIWNGVLRFFLIRFRQLRTRCKDTAVKTKLPPGNFFYVSLSVSSPFQGEHADLCHPFPPPCTSTLSAGGRRNQF